MTLGCVRMMDHFTVCWYQRGASSHLFWEQLVLNAVGFDKKWVLHCALLYLSQCGSLGLGVCPGLQAGSGPDLMQ